MSPLVGKAPAAKFFLSLFLTDRSVRSALWQVVDGQIEIIKISPLHEFNNLEQMLIQTDEALQELGPDSESTNEVLFCLESNWANGNGVLDEKKPILKRVLTDLSLKAIGFVVSVEVMAEIFQNKQAPATVLLSLVASQLEVAQLDKGKLLFREVVGPSDDLSLDLTEALARVEQDKQNLTYPARITLYSTQYSKKDLQKYAQQLMSKDWRDSHNFLQRPIVEVLKTQEVLEEIIKTAGAAVAQEMGLISTAEPAVVTPDFGFEEVAVAPMPSSQNQPVQLSDDNLQTPVSEPKKNKKQNLNFFTKLPKIKLATKKKSTPVKLTNKTGLPHKHLILAGVGSGLLALLIISGIFLLMFSQVVVALKPVNQVLSKEVVITLSPDENSSDPEKLILAVQRAEKTLSGSRTTASTGVKLIGDKATGKIELINKTDSDKIFEQGTVLSAEGLDFFTTGEVTVPAATIEENEDGSGESKIYGKKEVEVEAEEIGAEGNLAANTEFSIEDFDSSSYEAKAKEALTGGSSREIQVVSQKDQDEILAALKEELLKKAEEEFKNSSQDGQYYLITGNTQTISSKFTAEVGDEVNTFSLDLELEVEAYSYSAQDIAPLAEISLKDELPTGFKLVGEPEILSQPQETSGQGDIRLTASLSSHAEAELDLDKLKSEILGQTFEQAKSTLISTGKIKALDFIFQPFLANKFLNSLPKNENRVELKIAN